MTEDITRPVDVQLAQAAAEGNTNQDIVVVTQPPKGGEITLPSLPNRVYNLKFDPRLAHVRVIDVDSDGDLDVVLLFNADTLDESRIVFVDMVEATQSGSAPLLQVGETQFGADIVVQQAQALAGEQPTLQTTAPPGPQPVGTGATRYDDNFGDTDPLLGSQGVIEGVQFDFPSLERPEVPEDDLLNFLAIEGLPTETEVPADGGVVLVGQSGDDNLTGGAGDDVIFGQGGDDSLSGGPGADTFVYSLAADEGNDEILDFSTAEGDLLSFVNVTDADSSGTIDIEDVVDSFEDGGGPGAIDTLALESGTTIMITDVNGTLTDLASIDANSLINGV